MKAVARIDKQRGHSRRHDGFNDRCDAMTKAEQMACGANARNVWSISPARFTGAHFATMPLALADRCIKAGSRPGDTVLDPFGGAGTTGLCADRLGRSAVLIDLNPAYRVMQERRLVADAGIFAQVSTA
jgi:DNA modification methylase